MTKLAGWAPLRLIGTGDYYLPVLWLKPNDRIAKTLLFLDERGKAAAGAGETADQLANAGYEVILPDLSGSGELGDGFLKGGDSVIEGIPLNLWFTGLLTHTSLVAVRAEEIQIMADFIKKPGVRISRFRYAERGFAS